MAKEKSLPNHMKPEAQRQAQELKAKAIRAWAADHHLGTQPPTFPEISTAPQKSRKNIKRG